MLYIVMEYAEEDLSKVLAQRPLTPTEARDMLGPVLDALAYVHGEGFVHGHIKPSNIMALDEQLKVSNDGIFRIGESRGGLGMPRPYDSPETASGRVSPAGDVWSLGMTLIEVLTQRPPAWKRTQRGVLVLPSTVPAEFLDLVRHCLRRDPKLRWAIPDIAAWLHKTFPAPGKDTSPRRRETFANTRYAVAAVAIALLLAAILAGPKLLKRRSEAQRTQAIESERTTVYPARGEKPVVPASRNVTQTNKEKKQSPSDTAPSPTSARSEGTTRTPAGGRVQGKVVHQVLPNVPQKTSDTIQGTVRVNVKVSVDASGNVTEATLEAPGPSEYFADLALQAAQSWRFEPAKVDGRNTSSEWILRFERTLSLPTLTEEKKTARS